MIITGPHALYPQYIEFPPVTGEMHQQLLKLQLIPPNLLRSTDTVTVKITAAMDTEIPAKADHDPYFGVSDGKSFVGFITHDKTSTPCNLHEGFSGRVLTDTRHVFGSTTVASRRYSSEINIQIRPAEKWGSCHTEHDEGYTNIANYQHLLDLTKGLDFEMYRNHVTEKYRVKYLKIDVELD